jgi:hypothetical protein
MNPKRRLNPVDFAGRPSIEPKRIIFALAVFLCSSSAGSAQICADDNGNACLAVCGILTETCYDLGTVDPDGSYEESIFEARCTLDPRCNAYVQGINYCAYLGPCNEDAVTLNARLKVLRRAAPGAPIFIASCSGSLSQVDIDRRLSAVRASIQSRNPSANRAAIQSRRPRSADTANLLVRERPLVSFPPRGGN